MMRKRLGGLTKYTKEEKKKFEGNKPLLKYPNDYYPDRFDLAYYGFEEPKEFDLLDSNQGKRIDISLKKITFGIRASPEEFTQYDFLYSPDGPDFVVHKRVLDIFNKECPDDFQALPVIIKNLDPKGKQFENRDFWLINVLNRIDAIDHPKAEIKDLGDGLLMVTKKAFKADALDNHLLVIDDLTLKNLFHPSLARHFINSRGVGFLTDEEAPI